LIAGQTRYNTASMEERLQKLLAQAGYGSRRACEEFIVAGRVRVNGQIAVLGKKADLSFDKVTLDGKILPKAESLTYTYIALYKPRNVLSAAERQDDRETVRDLIPLEGHLYPVGRLDYDSEGLILMTNDGELTNKLTHPKFGHQKEYRVLVARRPDEKQLETWRRGVVLEDGDKTAPANVSFIGPAGKGSWISIIMGEGKKRQIREVGKLLGLPVVKIIRLRIGTLKLGSLKPRQWRHLTENEVMELKGEKGIAMEVRKDRTRDKRLHPTDRPKRTPKAETRIIDRSRGERLPTKEKAELPHEERQSGKTSRTESVHTNRTRSTPPKQRTPRR
jgi:23S rRNA pseudouridine2605 synthase